MYFKDEYDQEVLIDILYMLLFLSVMALTLIRV